MIKVKYENLTSYFIMKDSLSAMITNKTKTPNFILIF